MSGRHGGRHRFGRGGRGFFGSAGADALPRARRLGSKDLQLLILALLDRQACHGYQLIKIIEEHSGNFYSPSPGVIYPALTFLEETGYAHVAPDGAKKLYSITPDGQSYVLTHRAVADEMLDALARIGGRMDDVRDAFSGIGEAPVGEAHDLHQARQALKDALRRKRGCGPDEARRIVQILVRATADILRG